MTKDEFLRIMQEDRGYIVRFEEFTRDMQKETEWLLYDFNQSSPEDGERRTQILKNCSGMIILRLS